MIASRDPAKAARLAEKWHEKVGQLTDEILYMGINLSFDRGVGEKGVSSTKAKAKITTQGYSRGQRRRPQHKRKAGE